MNAKDRGVSTESRTGLDAEGPLRRWARRRREVAREEEAAAEARRRKAPRESSRKPLRESPEVRDADAGASEPAALAAVAAEPAAEAEKVLTDEDMPSLDTLDENSDYSGFLSPGVTEGLRRRALRKLFLSAAFNVRDGLDDYDDDFTSFEPLGDIVTSDMKHQAEMEAERAKQARAETEPASGLPDESGGDESSGDEGARLARADGEGTSKEEEGPVGVEAPAGSPAITDSEPPVPIDTARPDPFTSGADDGAEPSDPPGIPGRDPLPDAPEGAATGPGATDGAAARSSASEPAAGSEEAPRSPRLADGGTPNAHAGGSASTGADAPGDPGVSDPGRT